MKLFLIVWILVFAAGAGAQFTHQDSLDAQAGRELTKAIWEAAQVYYWDAGRWPDSLAQLSERHGSKRVAGDTTWKQSHPYLELDSATLAHWQFGFVPGPPQTVRAWTNRKRPFHDTGDGDCDSIAAVSVNYDVLRGRWSGIGVPKYGEVELSLQEQAELSNGVKEFLPNIAGAVQQYYLDKGEWPENVERLIDEKFLYPSHELERQWNFGILGQPPQTIVAISTSEMPDGAGHAIQYDVASGVWRGYGVK